MTFMRPSRDGFDIPRPGVTIAAMPSTLPRLVALLLLAAAAAGAGAAPLELHERVMLVPRLPADATPLADAWRQGSIKMPFASGGAPGVAERINAALFLEYMKIAPPAAAGKTFTPPATSLPEGTSTLSFMSSVDSGRLLSVSLALEFCGAYCESTTRAEHFDLRDGRAVGLDDLLTPAGIAAAAHRVDLQRRHAYEAQVRVAKAAIAALPKTASQDDKDDLSQRLALNQACLADATAQATTPDAVLGLSFEAKGHGALALTYGRCSNHAEQALDDVGDVEIALAPADLKPGLTPYGRALLLGEGDAPPPPAIHHRVMLGKLGGAAITMRLDRPSGGEIAGEYFYDRYRNLIAIKGAGKGDLTELTEETASQGVFDLKPAGRGYAGTWTDKTGKSLPVSLD